MRKRTVGGMELSGVYFTPSHTKILLAVMGREIVSKDMIIDDLWPNPDKMPDNFFNVLIVHIARINKKIRPLGWNIFTHYGVGYSLMTVEESAKAREFRRLSR